MRKRILENVWLKISAVLLAIFLWLFVTISGQSEMSLEIPIEFKNIPQGLGIVDSSAKSVSLTISGQEMLMTNVRASEIRVFVNLSKAKKGEGLFYINKTDIKLPYAMSVMNINPSSLKVRLDETVTRNVNIKPEIIGSPSKGFKVSSIETDPRTVKIHGLKSDVRKINTLSTEAFDITGLRETVTETLNIDFVGANIKTDAEVVKVKVVITGEDK